MRYYDVFRIHRIMKKYRVGLAALTVAMAASAAGNADALSDISQKLAAMPCYTDSCTYEVLLASLSEPVTYSIALESAAPTDTLAPCRYVISWQLPAPSGLSEGFSAYFDGAHFRYRDARLQEYHVEEDAGPFAPGGDVSRGVQCQVQFAELLPQFIAARFAEMASDTTYIYKVSPDTVSMGRRVAVVEGVRRAGGYDGAEYTYIFDAVTLRPLQIELENNPGQIGEQSIVVKYADAQTPAECRIDMATLSASKAEAFEKYRESFFTLDNLPGRPLPEIAAPTFDGQRYYHAAGTHFGAPTVIAFVESGIGTTPEVVGGLRSALAQLPGQVNIVWAFLDHRAEDVADVMEAPLPGETLLIHAAGAARHCGVGSLTPVLVFVKADGSVADVMQGFNKDLDSVVIEKVSICF